MKKRKVLICGVSGFIGRNLVEKFIPRPDLEIYGTYFKTKPDQKLLKKRKVKLLKADLTRASDVDRVVGGMDIIIQAAAVTSGSKDILAKPYLHVTDNAVMNSLIFRSSFDHKVGQVIFFSCSVMYPNQKRPVKEDDFDYQITDKYFGVGWTKVYLEKMCEFFSKIGNTKFCVIRHSNIYGPFDKFDLDKSHVFGATVTKVMNAKNGKLTVWGDGSEARDLLYVSDLVDFVDKIIESQEAKFELLNAGYGKAVSVAELVRKIAEISKKQIKIEFDKSKPTIKFSLAINYNRAKKRYNWKPKVTLEEGIQKTLDWYKENIIN